MEPQQHWHFIRRPPTPRPQVALFDGEDELSLDSSINLQNSCGTSVANSELESVKQNNKNNNNEGDGDGKMLSVRERIKMYNTATKTSSAQPKPKRRTIHISPDKSSNSRQSLCNTNVWLYQQANSNNNNNNNNNNNSNNNSHHQATNGSNGKSLSQKASVMEIVQKFQDAEDQSKIMERCRHCNLLKRMDQVHYCYNRKNRSYYVEPSVDRKNNGSCNNQMSNMSLTSNFNRFTSQSSKQEGSARFKPSGNLQSVGEQSEVEAIYDSKTTILKTAQGVRIIIDIYFDQNDPHNNHQIGNRIETDIPSSRILSEFQQQTNLLSSETSTSTSASEIPPQAPSALPVMSLGSCLMRNAGNKL